MNPNPPEKDDLKPGWREWVIAVLVITIPVAWGTATGSAPPITVAGAFALVVVAIVIREIWKHILR